MNSWNKLFIKNIVYPEVDINQYFDHIYYINLDRRIDRYESINNQLNLYNIKATKISGIEPKLNTNKINNGQLGCLLSHLQILQDADNNKYSKILILEDDTIFKYNFQLLFNRFIYFLPKEWDMIYLCGNHYGGVIPMNPFISKSYGTLTTNCYGITLSTISTILKILHKKNYDQPIDSIFCSIHRQLNTYISSINLCYQMATFSDIENKFTDYHILK